MEKVPADVFYQAFLSTLSLRRATGLYLVTEKDIPISIHALLAESDTKSREYAKKYRLFLSTLSLRRATKSNKLAVQKLVFLSTLSLRRATANQTNLPGKNQYFYPRSPCGERPVQHSQIDKLDDFYPRSPCGERPRAANCQHRSHQDFYPRSPCGERRVTVLGIQHRVGISIHALLAESDIKFVNLRVVDGSFLSTLSLRRATSTVDSCSVCSSFLSTLSLRRATPNF